GHHHQRQNQQDQEQAPAPGLPQREPGDHEGGRHQPAPPPLWGGLGWGCSESSCRNRSSRVWCRGSTWYRRPPIATTAATSSGTRSGSSPRTVIHSPSSSSSPKEASEARSRGLRPVTRIRTACPPSRSSSVPLA